MKSKESLYFIIGLILLSIVGIDIYWWIIISSDSSKTFSEVQAAYFQKFPPFLRNGQSITIINVVLLSIAAFLFQKSSNFASFKKLSPIFMIICLVLIAWQIFSLM